MLVTPLLPAEACLCSWWVVTPLKMASTSSCLSIPAGNRHLGVRSPERDTSHRWAWGQGMAGRGRYAFDSQPSSLSTPVGCGHCPPYLLSPCLPPSPTHILRMLPFEKFSLYTLPRLHEKLPTSCPVAVGHCFPLLGPRSVPLRYFPFSLSPSAFFIITIRKVILVTLSPSLLFPRVSL